MGIRKGSASIYIYMGRWGMFGSFSAVLNLIS